MPDEKKPPPKAEEPAKSEEPDLDLPRARSEVRSWLGSGGMKIDMSGQVEELSLPEPELESELEREPDDETNKTTSDEEG